MTNSTVTQSTLPGIYTNGLVPNPDFGTIKLAAGSTGTITNSTIAGNTGDFGFGPDSFGAAITVEP